MRTALRRYTCVTWLLISGLWIHRLLKPMDFHDGLRQRRIAFLIWIDRIFQSERKRLCDQTLLIIKRDIEEIVRDMAPEAEEDMRQYLKDLEALAREGYYSKVFGLLFPSMRHGDR